MPLFLILTITLKMENSIVNYLTNKITLSLREYNFTANKIDQKPSVIKQRWLLESEAENLDFK